MSQPEQFSGVWQSTYTFTSSSRKGEFENSHYLRAHQDGDQLVFESVPDSKSYVIIRMTVRDDVATGSWQEETEEDGYYHGAVYYGSIQMVVDEEHRHFSGKWVGFGKDMEVNVGPWDLRYVGPEQPR
jgi:hypothetical protein